MYNYLELNSLIFLTYASTGNEFSCVPHEHPMKLPYVFAITDTLRRCLQETSKLLKIWTGAHTMEQRNVPIRQPQRLSKDGVK